MHSVSCAVASLVLLAGCGSLLGLDDFSDGASPGAGGAGGGSGGGLVSSSSSSSASSTGGAGGEPPLPLCENHVQDEGETAVDCGGDCPPCPPDPCPGTHLCAPPAPPGAGWYGPVAMVNESVGCAAEFPQLVGTFFGDLEAGTATCTCSCGTPTVACSTSMHAIGYSGASCTSPEGQDPIDQNECYPQLLTYTHAVSLANPSATCGAGTVTSNIPKPVWATNLVSCGGFTEAGACPDPGAACMPKPATPFDGRVCIHAPGNVTCPAAYPNKTVYFEDFEDTRACATSCGCTQSGASCKVTVNRYSTTACGTLLGAVTVPSGGQACAMFGTAKSMRPGNVTVDKPGTCNPASVNPTGSAGPTEPLTVCCL